ncbi:hypothetical protein F9817_20160 [Vibrio sp. CAIM 722]|uniref:Uncharacterized protein n=1 Tax=Vibrio eleionomae TaxID=2653505 RepID=A0A7X4RVZ7_9VIBR|nr:hypothetical protein [Vibrio eleionomae]MZI95496.1 hypothetical protein [Vibrio eleionomae]
MMSTRKEYVLQDKNHFHAHIEVTRCGTIAIDIPETQEHFETELDCIEWQSKNGASCLICVSETQMTSRCRIQSFINEPRSSSITAGMVIPF